MAIIFSLVNHDFHIVTMNHVFPKLSLLFSVNFFSVNFYRVVLFSDQNTPFSTLFEERYSSFNPTSHISLCYVEKFD